MPVFTFENHCLEGKLTFGDPFLDSGVVGPQNHRPQLGTLSYAAFERMWHIQDSHIYVLALAFRLKHLKRFEVFSLRLGADGAILAIMFVAKFSPLLKES